MSYKTFCDGCGREILTTAKGEKIDLGRVVAISKHPQPNGPTLKVECLTYANEVANAGDWCKYCVIDAIDTLDDRPRSI
jgi:hypothetical protein